MFNMLYENSLNTPKLNVAAFVREKIILCRLHAPLLGGSRTSTRNDWRIFKFEDGEMMRRLFYSILNNPVVG